MLDDQLTVWKTAAGDSRGTAGSEAVEIEITQNNDGAGTGVDYDRVGAGGRNPNPGPHPSTAVDCDRLSDRHRSEIAAVEAVDLASGGRLRKRAAECLARCRAAARIRIVTNARTQVRAD